MNSDESFGDVLEPVPRTPTHTPLRRRLFFGSAYVLLATVFGQGFALLTSIIYARLLGTYDLGVLAIYAQVASLAVGLSSLGLATPITRFVAQLRAETPERLEKFIATVLAVTVAATAAVSASLLAIAAANGLAAFGSPELTTMVEIMALFLFLNSLTGVAGAVLQGFQRIRFLALFGIALEAFTVPVMFISVSTWGLVGAVLGGVALVVFSTAALLVPAWKALRKDGVRLRMSIDRESARDLTHYALPLLVSSFVLRIALFAQSSILALSLGFAETGLFRVASTITRVVAFVPAAISVPLLPAMAELYATASAEKVRGHLTTVLRVTALVGFPLALASGLLARPAIVILYGSTFQDAATLAYVLSIAGFIEILNTVATNALLGEGRTRALLVLDVGQAVVATIAVLALIRSSGLLGIGYAALLASVIYGAGIFSLLTRTQRVYLSRFAQSIAVAFVGFAVASIAVLTASALVNYWLGAVIIAASLVVSWLALDTAERRLLLGLVREVKSSLGRGTKEV